MKHKIGDIVKVQVQFGETIIIHAGVIEEVNDDIYTIKVGYYITVYAKEESLVI